MDNYGIQIQKGNEIETLMNLTADKKAELSADGKAYAESCSWENRAKTWTNKFFVGNVPPQASSITPNYGDCWFYVDDSLDPPASRLYMWLSDGTSDFFYDFLPPNF
jgi:hypothetical protein